MTGLQRHLGQQRHAQPAEMNPPSRGTAYVFLPARLVAPPRDFPWASARRRSAARPQESGQGGSAARTSVFVKSVPLKSRGSPVVMLRASLKQSP